MLIATDGAIVADNRKPEENAGRRRAGLYLRSGGCEALRRDHLRHFLEVLGCGGQVELISRSMDFRRRKRSSLRIRRPLRGLRSQRRDRYPALQRPVDRAFGGDVEQTFALLERELRPPDRDRLGEDVSHT